MIRDALLCLSFLIVMPGGLAASVAEDAVEEEAAESEQPKEDLEPTAKPAADSSVKSELPLADLPAEQEAVVPNETSVAEDIAGDALVSPAEQALRRALDTVSELQLVLASEHEGDGPIRGQTELTEVRRSLEDALVELTRLEQQQSLLQWLEGEGLRAALTEFDSEREKEEAQEALEAAAVAEAEVSDSDPVAVDEARLRGVKRAIDDAPFKEGKMQVLTDQLRDARVSSEQVAELIELFAFSRDKVEALVFLHPRLVDPERFDDLLATLKFASDRMAVRQRLGLSGS